MEYANLRVVEDGIHTTHLSLPLVSTTGLYAYNKLYNSRTGIEINSLSRVYDVNIKRKLVYGYTYMRNGESKRKSKKKINPRGQRGKKIARFALAEI